MERIGTDFLDAHKRHSQDAESLFQSGRWANADHLFGLAAECGLKRLMLAFGMPFDSGGDMPKEQQDRKHADGIWGRYEAYRAGQYNGYALPASNPFQNWDISQRYASVANFNQTRVEPHRNGAEEVKKLIRKARRDGLL
jgi:hypothetical protein